MVFVLWHLQSSFLQPLFKSENRGPSVIQRSNKLDWSIGFLAKELDVYWRSNTTTEVKSSLFVDLTSYLQVFEGLCQTLWTKVITKWFDNDHYWPEIEVSSKLPSLCLKDKPSLEGKERVVWMRRFDKQVHFSPNMTEKFGGHWLLTSLFQHLKLRTLNPV